MKPLQRHPPHHPVARHRFQRIRIHIKPLPTDPRRAPVRRTHFKALDRRRNRKRIHAHPRHRHAPPQLRLQPLLDLLLRNRRHHEKTHQRIHHHRDRQKFDKPRHNQITKTGVCPQRSQNLLLVQPSPSAPVLSESVYPSPLEALSSLPPQEKLRSADSFAPEPARL